WAVEIPGVGNSALAAPRLIGGKAAFEQRIIHPLHLPGEVAALNGDLPGAAAGTIHAVRAADDLVVLPAVAIELLPTAPLGIDFVPDPRDRVSRLHCSPRSSLWTMLRRTPRKRVFQSASSEIRPSTMPPTPSRKKFSKEVVSSCPPLFAESSNRATSERISAGWIAWSLNTGDMVGLAGDENHAASPLRPCSRS